jgi:hypothetical protein
MLLRLNPFAALADVSQDGIDSAFVDDPEAMARHFEADPAILALDPETAFVQVGVEQSFRLVVSVGNVMAYNTSLPRNLTYLGHDLPQCRLAGWKNVLYKGLPAFSQQ